MIELLIILVFLSLSILYLRSSKGIFIYLNLISIIIVLLYSYLHSYDVAMTEVAVGVSINAALAFYILVRESNLLPNEPNLKYVIILSFIISIILYSYLPVNLSRIGIAKYVNNASLTCMVSEILASFRGFDTLCETLVIFLSSIAILEIQNKKIALDITKSNKALNEILFILIYLASLIGLYIHINGDVSPGGGFQASAIFLFVLVFLSYKSALKNKYLNYIGMLIYLILGASGEFMGKNIMYYSHIVMGIQIVELAVLMCVMFSFFYILSTKFTFSNYLLMNININGWTLLIFLTCLMILSYDVYLFAFCYIIYLLLGAGVLNVFNYLIILVGLFNFHIPYMHIYISQNILILFFLSLPVSFYRYIYYILLELLFAILQIYSLYFAKSTSHIEEISLSYKYHNIWSSIAIYSITLTPGTISYRYDNHILHVSCVSKEHAKSIEAFLQFFHNLNSNNLLYFLLNKIFFYDKIIK